MSLVGKPGYRETAVGWIPADWMATTLGDEVASIVGGGTPSKEVDDYWGGDIPWASVKDFVGSRLSKTQDYITPQAIKASATNLIPAGTLITPTRMALGRVAIFDCDVAINQDLKAIFPKPSLSKEFLFYWFQCNADRIEAAGTGSTVKGIRLETLRDFGLAIPTLAEQRKIAAILTAVDDKLDVIARQVDGTQTLKQGLMQTLFSRGFGTQDADGRWVPHTNFKNRSALCIPAMWCVSRLGQIAPLIRRPVEIVPDATYPELGLRSYGKGTFHKPALLGTEVGNKRLFQIKAGDLLFSNVFAWEGAVAVAKPEDDGRYGSHRYMTCVVDEALADTSYVFRYLTTPAGITSLGLASPGGAGRNKTLGLSALADITMPLPPLAEQRKISQILDGVDAKLQVLESKQVACSALKRGLMQKLLTGEWRVKVDAETVPACTA